jgi:hypothetical protein
MKQALMEKTKQEIGQLPVSLRALWYAAHDDWNEAHRLVQGDPSSECAWVHAYLHRVEGDLGNARYWYQQAGKKPATDHSLSQELEQLIDALSPSAQADRA